MPVTTVLLLSLIWIVMSVASSAVQFKKPYCWLLGSTCRMGPAADVELPNSGAWDGLAAAATGQGPCVERGYRAEHGAAPGGGEGHWHWLTINALGFAGLGRRAYTVDVPPVGLATATAGPSTTCSSAGISSSEGGFPAPSALQPPAFLYQGAAAEGDALNGHA
jgi:hypothetical protein